MTNNIVETQGSLLSPGNFEHSFRVARMMAESEMVPKNYIGKPQDILIAMEMGVSLGLGALQAIQNVAVINGKPCIYGDAMLAVCSGHPEFEDIKEEPMLSDSGKVIGFKCTVKRKGRSDVVSTYTIENAQQAQLWGKSGPWKQYPERMLKMRARGFALRDSFADALGGIRIAEEVRDYDVRDITPKEKEASAGIESLLGEGKEVIDVETGEIKENGA